MRAYSILIAVGVSRRIDNAAAVENHTLRRRGSDVQRPLLCQTAATSNRLKDMGRREGHHLINQSWKYFSAWLEGSCYHDGDFPLSILALRSLISALASSTSTPSWHNSLASSIARARWP